MSSSSALGAGENCRFSGDVASDLTEFSACDSMIMFKSIGPTEEADSSTVNRCITFYRRVEQSGFGKQLTQLRVLALGRERPLFLFFF